MWGGPAACCSRFCCRTKIQTLKFINFQSFIYSYNQCIRSFEYLHVFLINILIIYKLKIQKTKVKELTNSFEKLSHSLVDNTNNPNVAIKMYFR